MSYDPSCLPSLPSCPDDIMVWAPRLAACVIESFNAAFDELGTVGIPTFDVCGELAVLGPGCLVLPSGIDQTQFTYASEDDQVVAGNGVLPVPPQPNYVEYRAGMARVNSGSPQFPGGYDVALVPPMPSRNYAAFLTSGNDMRVGLWASAVSASLMRINVKPWDVEVDEGQNMDVYWLVIMKP